MQKRGILLLLTVLLALALCACGGERDDVPPAETVVPIEPTPVQTPSPSPAPTPEPVTEIVLKNDNLPDDLQLTEYVACTNTNTRAQTYLDTGLSPTNDTTFIFDFACTSGFQTKDTWFFGCFDRDRHMMLEVGYHQGQGNEAHFYTATGIRYSQTENPAARTVAYLRPGDYRYPDLANGRQLRTFEEPCPQHLYIFSRQHMSCEIAGTYDTAGQYDLQVYACCIWQGGEPARDYQPCYCLSTGRAGMYDLVEGKMLYSAGEGEPTPGPDLLPPGSMTAVNGHIQGTAEPPELPGFCFHGYYTGYRGSGVKVIDETGKPCGDVETVDRLVLYAYWTRDEDAFAPWR